ncbi:MAG: MFS transporter, partial [Candidatus Eremiobacteraeota bacterium]|nr:MFS transporter [Candidatus Eremiobacteraeota bacterium]
MPRSLIPLYGITFLDILGFTILIPLLPFVAKRFGAPDVVAGALVTTTAVCASLASPLWGAISDRFGRKRALLGSQVASFVAYLTIALAGGLPLLFLSRAIEGLGGGNLGIASAYVADVTTDEQRPQALAFGTAAFGLGFVAGPIASGALAHFGFAVPFFVAAGLQAINVAVTAALLPESHAPLATRTSFADVRSMTRIPGIGNVLARRFLYIFAFTSFFTTFSLYLSEVFGLGPGGASALLAVAGGAGAAVQILLVGAIAKRFGSRKALLGGFVLGVIAYAAIGVANGIAAFVAAIVLWAASGSLLRPVLDARIAELAPPERRGTILGFGDSLDNVALIFAPTLGAAGGGGAPRMAGGVPAVALAAGAWLT